MAIDDQARIAFITARPVEKKHEAIAFLYNAMAYYAGLDVGVKRLLAEHRAAFWSKELAATYKALGVQHKFTRPYRPKTNGRAERCIQSALCEWASGWTYQNSVERTDALASWLQRTSRRPYAPQRPFQLVLQTGDVNPSIDGHGRCL